MLAIQVYQKPLPQVTAVFYQHFNSFSIPLNITTSYLLVLLIILNNYCSYIPYKLLKVFSLYFSLYSVVLLIYNTVLWTLNGDIVFEVFFKLCSHLFTEAIDSRSFVKSLHDFFHLILSSLYLSGGAWCVWVYCTPPCTFAFVLQAFYSCFSLICCFTLVHLLVIF